MLNRLSMFVLGAALFCSPLSARAEDPAKKTDKAGKKTVSVAHIKLSGGMDEKAPVTDPLLGQLGETFKGKIDRLKKAAADSSIEAVLLEIDGLSVGWGKMNELSRAVAHVRASGKKVYAYSESGSAGDYYLALACDDICMPEITWVMLTGIRAEMTFYKGLLAKLGIEADFLQMGDFKAAAEPYLRESMSEPNRKQMTAMIDDFFDNEIVGRIVKSRTTKKLTSDQVKEIIDNGPHSARVALKSGLIDRVGYRDTYEKYIQDTLKADTLKVVADYGKKKDEDLDIFKLYSKLLFGPTKFASSKSSKVAVIYATGAIMTGKSGSSLMGGSTVGSETTIKAIEEAEKDSTVKAIVLRVDSPGGSAVASDLIWHALKRCKKPIIASMSDVAASGGYYISMGAQKVYAEPGTITGSIGVIGGKMAMRGLYDKVGVKTDVIARGRNSGLLGGTDPFSPSQKEAFRLLMEDCYDQFLDRVLENRLACGKKMTRDELKAMAGGRVWTGRQARERGLVDELGTLEDAIAEAARLGGLPGGKDPELLMLPKPRNFLDSLMDQGSILSLNLDPALSKVPGLAAKLRGVDVLLGMQREPVWAIMPFRLEIK